MSEMAMYRRWQLRALDRNLLTLTHIVESISDSSAFDRRDGGDGWTISEVLGHLCDFERYMLLRARYILGEVEGDLPQGANPDIMVKERGYAGQAAADLLSRWQDLRQEINALYGGLDAEDDGLWQQSAPFGSGPFSLNNQLILAAMHDDDHMNQIVKIARG